MIHGRGGLPREWVTQTLFSSWEMSFQGGQPQSRMERCCVESSRLWSSHSNTQTPVLFRTVSRRAHRSQGLERAVPRQEQNPGRLSLSLSSSWLILTLNNLNMNFPNPSREFFENMKGTYITIERGQGWPRQFLLSFLAFRCCLLSTDVSALGEPRSELMLLCLLDPLRSAVSALPLFLQTRVPNKSRYSSKPGMSKSAPNANISSKGKQAGSAS